MPAAKLQPSPPSAQVPDELRAELEQILVKHNVPGVSIAIVDGDAQHDVCLGHAETGESASPMRPTHRLQIASLSKTVAAAFLCEYVRANGLSLDATVNSLLQASNAEWTLKSAPGCPAEWAEQVVHVPTPTTAAAALVCRRRATERMQVLLRHLVDHSGLGMHYVYGVPATQPFPAMTDLLSGNNSYGYESLLVSKEPGSAFGYSGGGFLVLQYLLELRERKPIGEILLPFLESVGLGSCTFTSQEQESVRPWLASHRESRTTESRQSLCVVLICWHIGIARFTLRRASLFAVSCAVHCVCCLVRIAVRPLAHARCVRPDEQHEGEARPRCNI